MYVKRLKAEIYTAVASTLIFFSLFYYARGGLNVDFIVFDIFLSLIKFLMISATPPRALLLGCGRVS